MKRKKLYILLLLLIVLLAVPYLFKRSLCVKVADSYLNADWSGWDTVFVNARPVNEYIEMNELSVSDTFRHNVAVWNEEGEFNPNYENITIIIENIFQLGLYTEADIEITNGNGSEWFQDRYIWIFFTWVRITHELTAYS